MSGISNIGSTSTGILANTNSNQSQVLSTLLANTQSQSSLLDVLAADQTTTNSSGDILDLSSQGQTAADQLFQLLETSVQASTQTVSNNVSDSIQKQLSSALSQAGIDTSQEIDLQLGSDGNVTVSNNNAQAQKIEDTINNNPQLKKAVTQYLKFMQTIAPSMDSSTSTTSSLLSNQDSGTDQLLSSLANSSASQGVVTLALQGNTFEAVYQDASNNSVVLASSMG